MCIICGFTNIGCVLVHSKRCGDLIAKKQISKPNQFVTRLPSEDNVTTNITTHMVVPIEENNAHHEAELAIANQCIINHSLNTGSTINSIESENPTPINPYLCARTFVMEIRSNKIVTDCSELELVHPPDDNDTTITMCYTQSSTKHESEMNCMEESSTNSNKDFDNPNLASQMRATPQKKGFNLDEELSKDVIPFASNDDGASRNESTFGVFSSSKRDFNYSNSSYKARIVGKSATSSTGAYREGDKPHKSFDHQVTLPHPIDISNDSPVKKLVTGSEAVHQSYKNSTVVDDHRNVSQRVTGYTKPAYPVLVGNSVKVFPTDVFALLPQRNKFLVKERLHDPAVGCARAKLVLRSSGTEAEHNISRKTSNQPHHNSSGQPLDNSGFDDDDDEDVTSSYYRQNSTSPGRVLYTRDRRFNGRTQYPVPNGKAVSARIGKGGNGFVFTLYHDRKQYAVKKTVYRANEINVHSALKHKNILPLLAVLMGEKHERHRGKFYCFHFMPRMDYDLRQILSSKDVGCMKYYYRNSSREPARWESGFNNIKFVLAETLEAVAYMHSNGFVHRDVKASNIMIKMRCHCRPLECTCSSKFQVKLGDFDSAGTVPGLGITEPTDQLIKFASILPLGTPGYRAPEVSMHVVLSGPYETLYTTAVDMWSFGCLILNICIGKTAAVKQREEAQLLLSRTHTCSTELWEKTTKINDLKKTKPFCNELELIRLVESCLQVDSANRPSANDAVKVLRSLVK